MDKRAEYIKQLEEFKNILYEWEHVNRTQTIRTEINKRLQHVRELVLRAGALKTFTISPPPFIGGLIMQNVDPFICIFNPPYDQSMVPAINDMIDVSIGVIESNPNFNIDPRPLKSSKQQSTISNRVFLVHGRDNELKESTARFLEKIGLQPIILHEQTNQGRTIIEKFEDYSDVAFAVILMTPDDFGGIASEKPELKKRARQNVVFELGYFLGKLGRKNVAALIKGDIELPSDYYGVIYIGLDMSDNWKLKLAKEMIAAGLNIDLNKTI